MTKSTTKENILADLMELCFCWDGHKVAYKTRFSVICSVISGICFHGCGLEKESQIIIKELLIKRRVKGGVHKFEMPEMISWCGCQPKNDLRQEKQKEYKIIIDYRK